jgi:hypothetical protein
MKQETPNHKTEFQPISLDYFLNMEVANGGGGKEIIKQDGKLKTVRDIVDYFSHPENVEFVQAQLKPSNWQYFNCLFAEFNHNVSNHHTLGWENMTKEYYDSLQLMTDGELETFLKDKPVEFDNGYIKHGYHRACAMMGRLINGKSYIPFYMRTEQIYSEDETQRIKPLANKISLLEELDKLGIKRDGYCLTQSSILCIMNVRNNDDLDIIVSSKLRNQNISFPKDIDVFDANSKKFNYFGASGDDDLIQNYCVVIDGYKFLEPRFYFARKNRNSTQRDINDWKAIKTFFGRGGHNGYPFNFEFYKWGVTYVNEVQISDLKFDNFSIIRNKIDRVVDGVNHGRAVYYDKEEKRYIKIFHKNYCRLTNFKEALDSGFLNGLCPALTDLIYDEGELIGYISEEGTLVSNNQTDFNKIPQEFFITFLRNCKKRSKIYYDFVPINIIQLPNGEYSLIDLESVYNLDELHLMSQHNAIIKPENLLELIDNI